MRLIHTAVTFLHLLIKLFCFTSYNALTAVAWTLVHSRNIEGTQRLFQGDEVSAHLHSLCLVAVDDAVYDSPVLPLQLSVGLHSTLHHIGWRGRDPGNGPWSEGGEQTLVAA